MIVNNVFLLRITLQQALSSSFNTNGAWVGKGRTSGSSYNDWEFFDGTKLDQCYDKECSSGEGKFTVSKLYIKR